MTKNVAKAHGEVAELARAELAAWQHRQQAEAAWRAAWWALTVRLGQVRRPGVAPALRVAAEELGQSMSTMRHRRELGVRVDPTLAASTLAALPPTLTGVVVETVDAVERVDGALAEWLLAAEERGVSAVRVEAEYRLWLEGTRPRAKAGTRRELTAVERVADALTRLERAERQLAAEGGITRPNRAWVVDELAPELHNVADRLRLLAQNLPTRFTARDGVADELPGSDAAP